MRFGPHDEQDEIIRNDDLFDAPVDEAWEEWAAAQRAKPAWSLDLIDLERFNEPVFTDY